MIYFRIRINFFNLANHSHIHVRLRNCSEKLAAKSPDKICHADTATGSLKFGGLDPILKIKEQLMMLFFLGHFLNQSVDFHHAYTDISLEQGK